MYIGISGTNCSGKGVFKEYLEKKYNAISISLSDILRKILKKRGKKEIKREDLLKLGNELRKKDPAILAKLAIKEIKRKCRKKERKMVIIDSIRNPYEITYLKKYNFYLFFIDAPIKIRYRRAKERKREDEKFITFKEFKKMDKKEMKKNAKKYEQNLNSCKKLADFIIINDRTKKEFYKKIDEKLRLII